MALQKIPIKINFSKGLDQKVDPYQIPVGNFDRIQNSVYNKEGRIDKRNGFEQISTVPATSNYLTTYNANLTSVGSSLYAYSNSSKSWYNKGSLQPVSLSTLSLVRGNTTQTQVDSAVSSNGLVCTVYADSGSGSTVYKYAVLDAVTGQNILSPAVIPSNGTITYSARVFFLDPFFVIVFGSTVTATPHLQYVAINSTMPAVPTTSVDLSTSFTPASTLAFDGQVYNNRLYLAWNGADVGGAIRAAYLTNTLSQSAATVYAAAKTGTMISVFVDSTSPQGVWITFWAGGEGYTILANLALNSTLILAPTHFITTTTISNLTSYAINGTVTILYEIPNNYGYDSAVPTHYIQYRTCTSAGVLGSATVLVRSVGLASKAYLSGSNAYFLSTYQSDNQNTYFLMNSFGKVVSKLAYSNGGGYVATGLPSITPFNGDLTVSYLFKDSITTVTKTTGDSSSAIYSQTGVNMAVFELNTIPKSVEIGSTLALTGGFLWNYDGNSVVENNFFVWPDNVEVSTDVSGGLITAQEYFYQAVYMWVDNQGNTQISAPSIPVSVTTTGSTSTNTITIPTLRLTYKTASPVQIVLYRYSVGQQEYHRTVQADNVGSVAKPLYNDLTVDYVTFTDTLADASILGNDLIYTTGGVVENISAPSFSDVALFDSRLWGINAEDDNLLSYSKQVIENTSIDMSDLFTYYTAPSTAVQGSSGPTKCLFPMDDKLILFKKDAVYFINGNGPDNTGANNSYTPNPLFITGTVGCENPNSIVLIPKGLMFESDKGIWLLDRSGGTEYIGNPVEDLTTGATVLSAISIPGTTQVRFTMSSGITLVYDYFFERWGTFIGIPAVSSVIYQDLHTYVNSNNLVFQETPGRYLDGAKPVLQGLTTSWISVSGLDGYQRVYFMNLLGKYLSPHFLQVQIAYDYNDAPIQSIMVNPTNYGGQWGNDVPVGNPGVWGGSEVWGGSATDVERERVFPSKQRCRSIKFIIDEIYDPSLGVIAGPGLSLSGFNITAGFKKSYPTPSAANRFG